MAVLMLIAACYGVFQLALLASATRSVRIGLLFLAVTVGLYGAGVISIILQLFYTRSVAALTGDPISQIVATASYTVDPFIEEVVKVTPLLLVALLSRKVRGQWGLTDFVLLGAAIGAGFALTEAVLRFSNDAGGMTGGPISGLTLPIGFSVLHIPGLPEILTSWVPESVVNADLFSLGDTSPKPSLHIIWSALGGLAAGLLLRSGWRLRFVAVALLLFVWLDHAAYNQRVVAPRADGFIAAISGVLEPINSIGWIYPLLALGAAGYLDWKALRGMDKAALTTPVLAGFATRGLPWTPLIAWRYVLLRRSAAYAQAVGAHTTGLREAVDSVGSGIRAANRSEAWSGLKLKAVLPPKSGGLRAYLPLIVWFVLLIPALAYLLLGTVPLTHGVQDLMASPVIRPLVVILTVLGMIWLGWQVMATLRALPGLLRADVAEPAARAQLRVLNGIGGVVLGLGCLLLLFSGTGIDQPILSNLHILDALGRALVLLGLMLALLSLFMFPPFGLAAMAGGGFLLVFTPTAALGTALAGSAVIGLLGAILMMAGGGGGGGSGRGGGEGGRGTPRNNQAQNKQFNDAIREAERSLGRKLDKGEIRRVHDEITGQNMGYHEIVETVLGMFGG